MGENTLGCGRGDHGDQFRRGWRCSGESRDGSLHSEHFRVARLSLGGVRVAREVSTVRWVVGMLEFVRGRGWRVSAVLVGVLALFIGGLVTATFDTDGVFSSAIAVGFVGIATLVLIPRTTPQGRRWPTRGTGPS